MLDRTQLEELLERISESIDLLPVGSLKLAVKKTHTEYYWKNSGLPSGVSGVYISKQKMQLAMDLAQKDYLIKLRKVVEDLLGHARLADGLYDEKVLQDVYYKLSPARQKLVAPLFISDEDYVRNWINTPFKTKGQFKEEWDLQSHNDESMRSKTEVLLATYFDKYEIPYRYEPEIVLSDGEVLHPDFQLLNKRKREEFIWEHLGMLGRESYADTTVDRNNKYARNGYYPGINLIYTFETNSKRTNKITIENYIKTYLL